MLNKKNIFYKLDSRIENIRGRQISIKLARYKNSGDFVLSPNKARFLYIPITLYYLLPRKSIEYRT